MADLEETPMADLEETPMADSEETPMVDLEETPMSVDDALVEEGAIETNQTDASAADIVTENNDQATDVVTTESADDVLVVDGDNAEATDVQYVAATEDNVPEAANEEGDGESKEFTAIDEDGNEVRYVTMTQEEAAAAGVEEDEQVVTTSLQFDPANPSVLYTADGTLINQADLSPEEQALVQAALQQHLAEQEAEQQLALIEQSTNAAAAGDAEQETENVTTPATEEAPVEGQATSAVPETTEEEIMVTEAASSITTVTSSSEPVAVISSATENVSTGVDFVSQNSSAKVVQTLADNVRRQAEYKKAHELLERVGESKSDLPEGYRYEEKIVIRQGQPQVVKVPVRAPPPAKRPEIPTVLANLMPKIEIGKDGSQVIRIHQSQITADQLKSLQENPNVRLVFRPASSSRNRVANAAPYNHAPRKRGRPRKNYISNITSAPKSSQLSPSKTNRYGRTMKVPYHQKDYLSGEIENGDMGDDGSQVSAPKIPSQIYPIIQSRRGRPPGSLNKTGLDRGYRRAPSYSRKMEQMREQELMHDEELTNARLSIVPQKPVLSSVELAISTRRKNRLRELLGACSEHEIMEVALPHLARVFSLWEFLVMKVETKKASRVYFADVYKEYEILHRYVARLTEKYKETLVEEKMNKATGAENGTEEAETETLETEKKKFLKVRCKTLAQSLGLEEDELEDAFITLLDTEELTPPPLKSISPKDDSKDESTEVNVTDPDETIDASALLVTNQSSTDATTISQTEAGNTGASDPISGQETAKEQENEEKMETEKSEDVTPSETNPDVPANEDATVDDAETAAPGTQIIQIGTGDDKQFIEVPEGYTLIQTPDGLVMSQPGTTLSQSEDGTIYVTHEDGTTTTLDSQKAVSLDTVDTLMTLDDQEEQQTQ